MSDVTQILSQIEAGNPSAPEQLLRLVYDELRKLAAQKMVKEAPGQTLQATALVHEAYLRLVDNSTAQQWNSKGHFFAAAAEAMRRILVENARRKGAQKHGGGHRQVPLEEWNVAATVQPERLLAIHDVLDKLVEESPVAAELVKLRVFAGLSIQDAAVALEVSRTTAFRHWTYARAWLRTELDDDG
jgi:RNA polymerase sigma factor (TIGR02999 family)